jgi:hypothetical protein
MTAGVIRDLAVLLAAAALPAGLALFLLRRGLSTGGPPFWRAATAGILALGALAVVAVWGATIFAEREIAACKALADAAAFDCDDNGLWVAIAGVPALAGIGIFILGAAAFFIARKLPRAG